MERKVSVRRRKYRKRWTEKCKDYFRNFLAFMFSNVGIIGLVVGYTVAGAFIFREVEKDGEKTVKVIIINERNTTAGYIWKLTNRTNIFDEIMWKDNINLTLLDYQAFVVQAIKDGYGGSDDMDEDSKAWSFPGAFLYALTVITTIGYGNVVPRTQLGKIITIIYAIIGMPLFLLYLSNIGDIMAKSFKWLYAKLCLCRCCPGVAKKRAERQRRRAAEASVEYFSNRDGSESPEVNIRRESFQGTQRVTYNMNDYNEQDDDNDDTQSETMTEASYESQTVSVPITVCFAIMVGYIFGGALLFSKYEEKWSKLDGYYFCFISLSTIGFGDFVPGKAIYSSEGFELSSIFGSMYLMLGMALIAMCFNLMQEEVLNKIRRMIRAVKFVFRCNR